MFAAVLGSCTVGMTVIQRLIIHGLRAFGLAKVRCGESDLPSDVVTGIVSVNLLATKTTIHDILSKYSQ